ncbi:hypothetical protein COCCADRAFT_89615, partial [Bipolaris zeicola 26-R-13]
FKKHFTIPPSLSTSLTHAVHQQPGAWPAVFAHPLRRETSAPAALDPRLHRGIQQQACPPTPLFLPQPPARCLDLSTRPCLPKATDITNHDPAFRSSFVAAILPFCAPAQQRHSQPAAR